jgi:hypothetical protein
MLALGYVHEEDFPDATAPVAPPPERLDERAIIARHESEQRSGVPLWRRSNRRDAKARAREAAAAEIASEQEKRERDRQALQVHLDERWRLVLANDKEAVFDILEAAFEDNEMPAAPIDVDGATATILMKFAAPDELIPEREVATTPTGKPTHKRRSKRTTNELYAEILASHVMATVKEVFAVAPAIQHIRVLAIRGDRLGGGLQLVPLYMGEFNRQVLPREWNDINVLGLIERHGEIRYKGQAQELAPLTTRNDPQLRAAVDELARQLDWKPAP